MSDSFAKWRERVLWSLLAGAVASQLAWGVWATGHIYSLRTDRELMFDHRDRVIRVIERNTAAINAIRIEMARYFKED